VQEKAQRKKEKKKGKVRNLRGVWIPEVGGGLCNTSIYWKIFDVLFATLWTKLAILSKNRGNIFFFSILPDNVASAM
jgi:hypothetical protein